MGFVSCNIKVLKIVICYIINFYSRGDATVAFIRFST